MRTVSSNLFFMSWLSFRVTLPGALDGAERDRYLDAVRAYAEAMLQHGRDTYGSVHSPLFASALVLEAARTLPH